MAKNTVKLDKERELKFNYDALLTLQGECGINAMNPATYRDFTPVQVRDLVWVGQLHTAKPLDRARVGRYLPTDTDKYMALIEVIAAALGEALGSKKASGDDQPQ